MNLLLYLLVEKRISNSKHLAVRKFSGEAHLQWLEQIHRLSFAHQQSIHCKDWAIFHREIENQSFSSEGIVCKFWPSCINTGSKINVYLTNINWLDFVWEALGKYIPQISRVLQLFDRDWTGPFVSTPLITRIPIIETTFLTVDGRKSG